MPSLCSGHLPAWAPHNYEEGCLRGGANHLGDSFSPAMVVQSSTSKMTATTSLPIPVQRVCGHTWCGGVVTHGMEVWSHGVEAWSRGVY